MINSPAKVGLAPTTQQSIPDTRQLLINITECCH